MTIKTLACLDLMVIPQTEVNPNATRFGYIEKMKDAAEIVLDTLNLDDFHSGFTKCLDECKKFIEIREHYLKS